MRVNGNHSVTCEQKTALIKGVTDLLTQVLNKSPAQTFVVIEEVDPDNWGVAGMTVSQYRRDEQVLTKPVVG